MTILRILNKPFADHRLRSTGTTDELDGVPTYKKRNINYLFIFIVQSIKKNIYKIATFYKIFILDIFN